MLGVCGLIPVSPGWLVLSATRWTVSESCIERGMHGASSSVVAECLALNTAQHQRVAPSDSGYEDDAISMVLRMSSHIQTPLLCSAGWQWARVLGNQHSSAQKGCIF